jgi:LPS O-antigen subunit length determinant protein (WzzB/FepE family)
MSEQNYVADDEISLLDIYEFLKDGWLTIAATTVLGGAIGVGTAFVLPEKFLASATIQPTRALGNDVESIAVLAEKMRSPTYYSQQSFSACDVADSTNPAQTLATSLKPNVAKNSGFVSVSFKSTNINTSIACLNAVLDDVIKTQFDLKELILQRANEDLRQARQRLVTSRIKNEQELKQNKEQLSTLKEKLRAAQQFVSRFENNAARFDFKDDQFSASSLLLATILSKQNEVKDLQIQINNLEMKVAASLTGREDELLNLEKQIKDIERNLLSPATMPASFTTPIYGPAQKIEPKRSIIALTSVLAGGFIGLMLLVLRRAVKNIKQSAIKSVQPHT